MCLEALSGHTQNMWLYVIFHFVFSLLVLGMEHYGSSAWQEIQKNLLPTKTIKQVGSQDNYNILGSICISCDIQA